MKNLLIIVGIALIVAALGWYFTIAPQSNQRFPDGYEWELDYIGLTGYPDEETGEFAETPLEDDPIALNNRTVTVSTNGDTTTLTDNYVSTDPSTSTVIWEFALETEIDPLTGQHVTGETDGDYYFLPQNLDKDQTYIISNSTYVSLPMDFQDEVEVAGINTYHYAYAGEINNELAYFGFVELEEGQTVICSDFSLDYWVEPNTGEIIKYRELCQGDYVVDIDSGEQLYGLQRWGGESTGDDQIRQAREVRNQLNAQRTNTLYVPGGLGLAGVIVLAFAFRPQATLTTNE